MEYQLLIRAFAESRFRPNGVPFNHGWQSRRIALFTFNCSFHLTSRNFSALFVLLQVNLCIWMVGVPQEASVQGTNLEGGFKAFGQALEFVDGCNGGAGGPLRVCACCAEHRGDEDQTGECVFALSRGAGLSSGESPLGLLCRVCKVQRSCHIRVSCFCLFSGVTSRAHPLHGGQSPGKSTQRV